VRNHEKAGWHVGQTFSSANPTYDVIVVGGGPAGSTAARVLGENGISTLLLDKSAFPRDKPCGGGISARVMGRFPYLESALAGIPVNWVSKIYFEAPSGVAVDYCAESPLYLMIRRCEFDNLLFSIARKQVDCVAPCLVRKLDFHEDGATLHADVAGEPKEYRAKMVLGCDGANSIVARAAGLRSGTVKNEFAIDMMEETPYSELSLAERDRMFVYYGYQGSYGYSYVFPKKNHLNLGIGCKLDHYLAGMRGAQYAHHRKFVDGLIAQKLLTGASNRANFRAFPLPISGPLSRTYAERTLLSGDAGGFVNAFTAEGIYYAMVSGELAARTAVDAIRAQDTSSNRLSAYAQAWKKEIGEDLSKSVSIQRLLMADLRRVDRIVRAASRDRALAGMLARYATGARSYRQFKRSMLLRAFPLYIREKTRAFFGPRTFSQR
jgi:geranylgeranyl reductase family protein